MHLPFDPLLFSILAPLGVALLLLAPWPERSAKGLALLGFLLPALLGLHTWWHYQAHLDPQTGYAFRTVYDTGLRELLGISLHLGLNGISMPMFLMAGASASPPGSMPSSPRRNAPGFISACSS